MVNEVKEPEKKPSRFAKLFSAVKDNKFISSFVLETTPGSSAQHSSSATTVSKTLNHGQSNSHGSFRR